MRYTVCPLAMVVQCAILCIVEFVAVYNLLSHLSAKPLLMWHQCFIRIIMGSDRRSECKLGKIDSVRPG